jgi:sodium/proline symporter
MGDGNIEKLLGVGVYLLVLLVIGAVASRRVRNLKDYFAGGKQLGFLSVAFSARATGESGWLLIGLTGMGAAVGLKAFWVVVGEVLGVGIAWIFLSRRFKRLTDQYDSITVPDYLESRFRDTTHQLRLVSAVALTVFVTIYVSAQFHATGKAFEDFLSLHYMTGVLLGFMVVMAYSTSGGFLAVVWSDVFQGAMMVVALVVLPLVAITFIGGWTPMVITLREIDPHLITWSGSAHWGTPEILQVIALVAIGLGFLGSPQIFVRFLALRSEKEIKNGTIVALLWTLLADSGAVLIGMVGRALYTTRGALLEDTPLGSMGESVLEVVVHHQMPIFEGLFIAVVLAAIMSTVDSLLILASSAAVRDAYQKILRPDLPDETLVGVSRRATFVLGLAALALTLLVYYFTEEQSVFWFVIFGWSGIAATFCPTLILSLFWSKFTRRGAMAAMISGFICVPLFKFVVPNIPYGGATLAHLEELAPAFAISLIVGVIISVFDSSGQSRLKESAAKDLKLASAPPSN